MRTRNLPESWQHYGFLVLALASLPCYGELQHLEDGDMARISGQAGISLEVDMSLQAARIAYFDDGNGIFLENFRIGSATKADAAARHVVTVDIQDDAALNLSYLVEDRRIEFGDVRLAGAPGVSMGGMYFDHNIEGTLELRSGGVTGTGYQFDSAYTVTGGRLGYRTNGNEVFLDDIVMAVQAPGVTLDVVDQALVIGMPSLTGSFSVGAMRYSDNPLNHGSSVDVGTGELLPSYGSLQGDFDLSGEASIRAGGRSGEGLRIDSQVTVNSASLVYRDDGHELALRQITGSYAVTDLRLDVSPDWKGRNALALTLGKLDGVLDIGRIEIGDNGRSLGSVNLSFLFEDGTYNGLAYTNALYLQGGGHADAGSQGLRLAAEWSLRLSDLSYIEDGNRVIFSGLQSWGRGDVTVNVTREGVLNDTRFFDGLRVGFEGMNAGYRLNGLRVGDDDAPLQGGTELLLALGFYPAYEFELDGHVTLGAGGASGEGLTINSDIQIRNGRAAIIASPYDEGNGEIEQKGLWITELSYDAHLRSMTVDVTDEGLAIIKGEAWSTMDIGNLRVGGKEAGESFGRFVVQRYETGSSMIVAPGGAGDVCVGGTGSSAASCLDAGGLWETRGEEGITVRLKEIFARAVDAERRNALTWETHRALDGSGKPVNGSGMRLVLNDIYTSDGADFDGDGVNDNTFGVQTDLSVDVYQTRVVKKQSGPDSNGVVGSKGDEKIMDGGTLAGYRYVSAPTDEEKTHRPLGFAVSARTRFRELGVGNVDLVHPVGGAQTAVYGVSLQNFDIRANLTATPIP